MSDKPVEIESENSGFLARVCVLVLYPLAGFTAVLLFAAFLISLRLEKSVVDLIEERTSFIALQLNNVVEGGLRFGVSLPDQVAVPGKMLSLVASDDKVLKVALFDETGSLLFAESRFGTSVELDPRTIKRFLAQQQSKTAQAATRAWRSDDLQNVVMQARDALGMTGGVVWIVYSATGAHEAFVKTIYQLLSTSAEILGGSILLIFGVVTMIWRRWEEHVSHTRLRMRDDTGTVNAHPNRHSPLPGVSLEIALQHISTAESELLAIDRKITGTAL